MERHEWDGVVALIESLFERSMPHPLRELAYADLEDVDAAQVASAVRALRLSKPNLELPTGALIRHQWVELAVDAPPPSEAAAELRTVVNRNRDRLGKTAGDQASAEELGTQRPVLATVLEEYGGPPPYSPSEQRQQWQPVYAAAVAREKRRLLLRKIPSAGLAGLERVQNGLDGAIERAA